MRESAAPGLDFGGIEVVAFESRMAREMASLIERHGGVPRVAPSMREVPLEENSAAFDFAGKLFAGGFDAVIFLTGVGTRTLLEVLETKHTRAEIVSALSRTTVVARGPKPVKVLREFHIPITITAPEPNTWRDLLQELDENPRGFAVRGSRIAIQEYGVSNVALIEGLSKRGAEVNLVPVYRWTLPEDTGPLESAIKLLAGGNPRVLLFTNAAQVDHLLKVAEKIGLKDEMLKALAGCVVCSVGPACSEFLRANQISVDLEPEHPKMGPLVQEAAKHAPEMLRQKITGQRVADRVAVAGLPGKKGSTEVVWSTPPSTDAPPWRNSRFMKACRMEKADVTPVWLMRQAGRYMKEYRDLRAKVPFLELCKSPDLVSEVTVTAAKRIGADAAIIFADLLLIAEPLGFGLEYDKGEGPVISPALRENNHVDNLREVEPRESLAYFYEAIHKTRADLPGDIPLIGFAGAPFTLASYLIEGGGSRNYIHTKSLMYRDAGAWRALMELLARNLAKYVNAQFVAGVQAVQIFDTWVGCLPPADYREFVAPYTRMMIQAITPEYPVIHFGTGTGMLLPEMKDAGGNIIGLDFRVELDEAWSSLGNKVGVQGNLDPVVLYADLNYIRKRVQKILDQAAGRPGHIFNLGHGILPDTPFDHVTALIEMVHEMSAKR